MKESYRSSISACGTNGGQRGVERTVCARATQDGNARVDRAVETGRARHRGRGRGRAVETTCGGGMGILKTKEKTMTKKVSTLTKALRRGEKKNSEESSLLKKNVGCRLLDKKSEPHNNTYQDILQVSCC